MKTLPSTTPAEPATNGSGQHPTKGRFGELLDEAQSIQIALRDALARSNHLLTGLKTYRRQARAMSSTLASLRQLQEVEA